MYLETTPPKVFVSYSWEGDAHKEWVCALSERLTLNGVNVRLDQWHISPGQSLTQFMETEVQTCEFVLVVCTKDYCRKSLARVGGVGYEQQIIAGNIVAGKPREHFIPLVRDGEFAPGAECSIPPQFMGVYAIDMRDGVDPDQSIEVLLRAIYCQPVATQPSLGPKPTFADRSQPASAEPVDLDSEDIRLPVLEIDGWHLRSGVASHHQWPETFEIPDEKERRGLVDGDVVKLQFEIEIPNEDTSFGERMWVIVRGRSGPYFIGELNNNPATSDEQENLAVGDRVVFLPEHVISIYTQDGLEIHVEDDAEPFHREDLPQQARPSLSCQAMDLNETQTKTQPLERTSWIAGIVGAAIGCLALAWSIWTYFKPPESPPLSPSNSTMNSGKSSIIIQGNGNTVVASSKFEAAIQGKTQRYVAFSISDQTLDLLGKKRHEVHFPRLDGAIPPDVLARSNHFLKRVALTAYEDYVNWDEVNISYKIGFKDFNLLGINYSIFMGNDDAAHPLSTTNAIVLNIETGTEFELKEFFQSGYLQHLNTLVRANLAKQGQYFPCDSDKSLDVGTKKALKVVQGTLKDILGHESSTCFSSVKNNSQFYLTDTSLVFVFPKYSVAPGASGDVEVPVNFRDLKSLLHPKGPLRRFL